MMKYALLANPGHNRVYFETSKTLSLSELSLALSKVSTPCSDVGTSYIGGIFYVTFSSEAELNDKDIDLLSRLSFVYAIFLIDGSYLVPVEKSNYEYINSNINTILKYSGKTNELFTRMMLNVALYSSDFSLEDNIRVLDPIAGKGTTLYDGLVNGFSVYGVEIDDKSARDAYAYVKKYLETEKYKHTTRVERFSGDSKSFKSTRLIFDIARSKDELRNKQFKHFELVSGNSAYCDKYFKKNFFNLIVGDLPYGVQHGNVAGVRGGSSLTRNPEELIKSCIDSWYNVLMPGGCLVLAWNTFVFPREKFIDILEGTGLTVLKDGVYSEFIHRVDQSIKRDIIVAKK